MESKDWLIFGRQNHIGVTLEGQEIPLRYTCHQYDCYRELINAQKRKLAAERDARALAQAQAAAAGNADDHEMMVADNLVRRVDTMRMDSVDVVEIALNPEPGAPAYSREKIERLLDLDQISILAQVWIDRKVFNPRLKLHQDPPVVPQT